MRRHNSEGVCLSVSNKISLFHTTGERGACDVPILTFLHRSTTKKVNATNIDAFEKFAMLINWKLHLLTLFFYNSYSACSSTLVARLSPVRHLLYTCSLCSFVVVPHLAPRRHLLASLSRSTTHLTPLQDVLTALSIIALLQYYAYL